MDLFFCLFIDFLLFLFIFQPIPQDNRSLYYEQMSNVPLDNMAKRYPSATYPDQINQMNTQMGNLNVAKTGFNGLWVSP